MSHNPQMGMLKAKIGKWVRVNGYMCKTTVSKYRELHSGQKLRQLHDPLAKDSSSTTCQSSPISWLLWNGVSCT